MPAIRPEPRDTEFDTPARADTGAGDYFGNLVYDTLYHSPVGTFGMFGGPTGSVGRFSELYLAKNDRQADVLQPQQAQEQYGLEGELKFDEPITDTAAQIMHDRKIAEIRRNYALQSGVDNHWGRSIAGFGVSMVAQLVDPVNLAAMFTPVVGESKLLSGFSRAGRFLEGGLISPKTLAGVVGTNPLAFRAAKGALEGLVGMTALEPFNAVASIYEGADYSAADAGKSLLMGMGMGAALHGIIGAVQDRLSPLREGIRNLDPQTHEASVLGAVSDLAQDHPVSSPEELINVDHNMVKDDLQKVNNDHVFRIAQDLKIRLDGMKESGIEMTPKQESIRKSLTGFMEDKVYKNYQTAKDIAQLLGLEFDKDTSSMPSGFEHLLTDKERAEKLVKGANSTAPEPSVFGIQGSTGTDTLYKKAFDALFTGSGKIDGVSDPLISQAKPFFDAGKIKSPEDLKALVVSGALEKPVSDSITPSPQSVNTETQSRVKNISQKEKSVSPEKSIDTKQPSDQAVGLDKQSEKPEPVVKSDKKTISDQSALVKEDSANMEKSLGELTPAEEAILKGVDESKIAPAIKSAIEQGINCIGRKVI